MKQIFIRAKNDNSTPSTPHHTLQSFQSRQVCSMVDGGPSRAQGIIPGLRASTGITLEVKKFPHGFRRLPLYTLGYSLTDCLAERSDVQEVSRPEYPKKDLLSHI